MQDLFAFPSKLLLLTVLLLQRGTVDLFISIVKIPTFKSSKRNKKVDKIRLLNIVLILFE